MNTKVDLAMDKLMQISELFQMNLEELDDFQDSIEKRIYSLRLGAIQTQADRMQEHEDDCKEEEIENDE